VRCNSAIFGFFSGRVLCAIMLLCLQISRPGIAVYEKTKSMIEIAKANALSCRDFQNGANPNQTPIYELNSYTNVDKLISAIEKFSQSE